MNHGSPITVHGGGTAGSAAAFLLARAGRRVLHVVDAERGRPSPPEILSPWARSLLAQLGLPEPREATPCEGVLSFLDGSEPEFND